MPHNPPAVTISPKHFNVQLPFQIDNRGILINTYWGSAKTGHVLYLDNHSPSWASNYIIRNNSSISKSKEFLYSTTTADGNRLEGDVYICDSILVGPLCFKNVTFYNISTRSDPSVADGVIGENMMAGAIWKIDFKHRLLYIASAIDSIEGLQETSVLPAVFTDNGIEIETKFGHGITQKIELDLGYNGWIIMPEEQCRPIIAGNKKTFTNSMLFSTPGSSTTTKNIVAPDSVRINQQVFTTFITTNEKVKEKLIGLRFFSGFSFLVIDYVNKNVYLSKRSIDD